MENLSRYWTLALWLAAITVFYNIVEGVVSVFFGASDETLSLFGFGLDSFVEVISGIGIWHMVTRTRKDLDKQDSFERTALRVTGIAFYLLAGGLVVSAVINIVTRSRPETTLWGIIISLVSIATMIFLMKAKLRVGKKLDSDAIIADAHCTRTCVYLSVVLLVASVLFELFEVGFIDALGAVGIAWYSFLEGRESLEKAKGKMCCCDKR